MFLFFVLGLSLSPESWSLKESKAESLMSTVTYGTPPPIFGVNLSSTLEQQRNDVGVSLTRSDMQSRPIIDVPEIDVDSRIQKLLDPIQIGFIGQIHEPHSGIDGHLVLLLLLIAHSLLRFALRRQRRLLPQSEPQRRRFQIHYQSYELFLSAGCSSS